MKRKLETKTDRGTETIVETGTSLHDEKIYLTVPALEINGQATQRTTYKGVDSLHTVQKDEKGKPKQNVYIPIETTDGLKKFLQEWEQECKERRDAMVHVVVPTLGSIKTIDVDGRKSDEEILENCGHFIEKSLAPELKDPEGAFLEALEEAREKKAEKKRRKREQKEKERAEYEEAHLEAQKTGEPVLLKSYSIPCRDPREECNLDIVHVYVHPNGEKKENITHTW